MNNRRIYCLVPLELAGRLHDTLRRHYRDDPEIEVVVERRRTDRRSGAERRSREGEPPKGDERRRIRNPTGRRVDERRAALIPLPQTEAPELPRRVRHHAAELVFVERLAPSTEKAEDADTARLVTRIQAGEKELFSELYMRYFDRVYGYLRVLTKDHHEAEDLSQQVFISTLENLPGYERRRQPFRAWLFIIARNQALAHLRKQGRISTGIASVERERAALVDAPAAESALRWISDSDLVFLIERLPDAQRNVLALRFLLGLSTPEIARVLDRSEGSVRMLQSRALGFLRERLTALGHAPRHGERARMWRWPKQARVLRARRYGLIAPGPNR